MPQRARRPSRVRVAIGCCALAAALGAPTAGAQPTARAQPAARPTKAACSKANADGQALRMEGKLAEARAQLRTCMVATCPALVREDCASRLDELERTQPMIVFDVKDTAGADVSAVTVTVDGAPLARRLEGRALAVDPGDHTFEFSSTGLPPVTRNIVIREGEKDRRERIVLGVPPAPAAVALPVAAPVPASHGLGTQKIMGLTTGGVGIAGLAAGSIFGALTFSAVSQQKSDCLSPTQCNNLTQAQSAHSSSVTEGNISTAAFIAGAALLAGGALLFLTAPSASAARESARLRAVPSLGPGGAGVIFQGGF